jgi:hypothetical protein
MVHNGCGLVPLAVPLTVKSVKGRIAQALKKLHCLTMTLETAAFERPSKLGPIQ